MKLGQKSIEHWGIGLVLGIVIIMTSGVIGGTNITKVKDDGTVLATPPAAPRPATMPGSSDPSGDEWPMFRGALNHTGVATTTPTQGAGPIWNYTTGNWVQSSLLSRADTCTWEVMMATCIAWVQSDTLYPVGNKRVRDCFPADVAPRDLYLFGEYHRPSCDDINPCKLRTTTNKIPTSRTT